jgi:hypothetical protein
MIGKLMCLLGRHDWERQSNPEIAGEDAVFYICSRCKHERNEYKKARPDGISGGVPGGG